MIIYAVDDEPLMLESLKRAIQEAVPDAQLQGFLRSREVLSATAVAEKKPDVIFTDIEMPGIGGLEMAVQLKTMSPDTRIVFVTGYSEYAVEAFKLHASGFVMKPVTKERILEELEQMPSKTLQPTSGDKLQVRCFGAFEVFWHGQPLMFTRTKTKELLAYLIDRRGELCTGGEIITALWEDGGDLRKLKTYLRTLTADLQSVLASIGQEGILIREHRQWGIRPQLLDCDYYHMLDGDVQALNSFRGEYMSRYSWAEMTLAKLQFV